MEEAEVENAFGGQASEVDLTPVLPKPALIADTT